MKTKYFSALFLGLTLAFTGLVTGVAKPAQAATIGTMGGGEFVREIRVVRLYGQRIASVTRPVLETGGSPGVDVDLALFRNQVVADYEIDTGDVAEGTSAFGWMRLSGSLTFNNTTSSIGSVTILTDMLAQGRILNADPDKVNTLEATVSLIQDGTSVFSAVMGGPGVTSLNSRTGAGSPFGGITALSLSPFSTSVVEYSFFAQVIVNGPVMSPVPLPASGLFLLIGVGAFAVARRKQTGARSQGNPAV